MLSVIIPTQNSERRLVPVLSALVQGVTVGVLQDVTLVDYGSSDGTATIAEAAGCTFLHSMSDMGLRLRQGAEQARGRWILFLSSQSVLEEGWARDVAHFIETAERREMADRTAATFRLAIDGYGIRPRLGEAMATARLALLGLPEARQGLLISRRHYGRIGGHPSGAKAAWRLAARIGRRHIRLLRAHVLLPERAEASA